MMTRSGKSALCN